MLLWGRKPFIALRVFGTEGQYPSFEIRSARHVFVPSESLVWAAVIQPVLPDDWDLGEVVSLVPEEVRLLSAIALCERDPWERPRTTITHLANSYMTLGAGDLNLTAPAIFEHVADKARSIAPNNLQYRVRPLGSRDDALALLERIDVTDQLLLAGLARLLGAGRLIAAHNEREEAAISLYVSMGAALEFIRLHLSVNAETDISFGEVHAYLRRALPNGNRLAEYFAEQYEERIIATHPSNRFGEFWAPPLMADDVYDLQKSLIVLFRHILLDENGGGGHAN